MAEGTQEERLIAPPPASDATAPPRAPSKRKADYRGFTPNKRVYDYKRVAPHHWQQLSSRIAAESPPIHVIGLRPKLKRLYRKLCERVEFDKRHWQNENSMKGFMEQLYKASELVTFRRKGV
ncbi:hypothetical protein BT69DRAFT_1361248 [Atractiella rhizophila]|nr:hypothetical protein BT69DRAFT_1361248 [Atractiella rhizophila]